jgi:hypothetical protein
MALLFNYVQFRFVVVLDIHLCDGVFQSYVHDCQVSNRVVINFRDQVRLMREDAVFVAHFNRIVGVLLVDVLEIILGVQFRPAPRRYDMRASQNVIPRLFLSWSGTAQRLGQTQHHYYKE